MMSDMKGFGMEQFSIVMGLIGVMFICIIGIYSWTYKVSKDTSRELGDIYRVVNGHLQNAEIHGKKDDLVSMEVCNALHGALKENIVEIKGDVKKLLARVRE